MQTITANDTDGQHIHTRWSPCTPHCPTTYTYPSNPVSWSPSILHIHARSMEPVIPLRPAPYTSVSWNKNIYQCPPDTYPPAPAGAKISSMRAKIPFDTTKCPATHWPLTGQTHGPDPTRKAQHSRPLSVRHPWIPWAPPTIQYNTMQCNVTNSRGIAFAIGDPGPQPSEAPGVGPFLI